MKFHKLPRISYWSDAKIFNLFTKDKEQQTIFKVEEFDKLSEYLDNLKYSKFELIVDKIQDIVMFPGDLIYSIKIHFKNAKGNTHVLDGGLEKGQWYDLCYRIPQCLFYELEKFILVEKGLEVHEWEKTLMHNENWVSKDDPEYGTLTPQALAAIEQDEIYNWWKANKDREYESFGYEGEYRKQEEEMLIRLVKIRNSLWT